MAVFKYGLRVKKEGENNGGVTPTIEKEYQK
jgi:hypothetical protein